MLKDTHHNSMKTIVLTGGGTAGHIMPNLALIKDIEKHFDRIVYIGSCGAEKEILKDIKNVEFFEIPSVKFIRKLTPKNLAIPVKLLKSINQSKKILKDIQPSIIFSKGGYVSIPVAIAGWKLKIPVITHESDISLGLANKIISKFSKAVAVSFEDTVKQNKKATYTGSPIRPQIFNGKPVNLNLDLNKKTLLITGGSLGAKSINDFIRSCLPALTNKYNIIHLCGKGKTDNSINAKNYYQIEFAKNIEDYFATADLVISRAGANTAFELLALKKPTMFIPLPKSESRGDQIDNAKYFAEKNLCEIVLQEDLNQENLIKSLNKLEKNKQIIKNLQQLDLKQSNKRIIDLILKHSL